MLCLLLCVFVFICFYWFYPVFLDGESNSAESQTILIRKKMEIGSGFKFFLSKFLIRFEFSLKVEKVDDSKSKAIIL